MNRTMDVLLADSVSYTITVAVTVIIVFVSTVYTVRNIIRARKKETSRRETSHASADTQAQPSLAPETESDSKHDEALEDVDPMEYAEHIQSEVKKAKQRITTKKLTEKLTDEQLQEEQEIKKNQLQAIFELMQSQNEKFGIDSMEDVQQQMKLYA